MFKKLSYKRIQKTRGLKNLFLNGLERGSNARSPLVFYFLSYVLLTLIVKANLWLKPGFAGTLNLGVEEVVTVGQDILDNGNSSDSLWSQAAYYAINILGEQLENDCPEILRIIPGPCPNGATEIPEIIIDDVPKTSAGFRTTSLPSGEFFTSNFIVSQRDFANLYDQEYARAQAERLLGDNGDLWLEQNVTATTALIQENQLLVEEIADLTREAHSLEVTQDVMKNSIQVQSHMASISLNQSLINSQIQASLLSVQQQQASLMQLNANLGEALDEANRRDRLEREALYLQTGRALIYIPGFEW